MRGRSGEDAFLELGQSLGRPPKAVKRAYRLAKKAEAGHHRERAQKQEQLLKQEGLKVLLAAHSYVVEDAAMGRAVTDYLKGAGVEAAQLDGASFPQLFRHVYLPNIKPTAALMSIMIVIFSFLAFDYVNLLTQGGPAHYTEVLATLAYTKAFSERRIGMASAISVVMSAFGLIASILYTRLTIREERD